MQFGDWLDPAAPPESPGAARTPAYVGATACLARSAELVSQIAGLLGHTEAGARYGALAAEVRTAFAAEYVTPAGRVLGDSATAYCMALQWALLPDEGQRRRAGERLLELVRADAYHIATGFVGTPLVCDALCALGYEEAAYRLLTQRECPSWLYPVTMGATTIWERWDSMLPDGSVNPGEMTSFNHYALGAVADWLHRHVAGLAPAEPGYRRMEISPRPGAGMTYARAQHRTPYGTALCACVSRRAITVEAEIPANTWRASLCGPRGRAAGSGVGPLLLDLCHRPPPRPVPR
jgi:alpha-L-rhamnosidase